MARHAWIRELTENDAEGRLLLTGGFTVSLDDGQPDRHGISGWDAAVAWARERADVLYHDAEDEHRYSVFGVDPFGDCPPLPEAVEAALREGERRPLKDRWLDRSERDAPVEWETAVVVEPDRFGSGIVEQAGRVGARLAAGLQAAGCERVSWFDDGLTRFSQMEVRVGEAWTFYGPIGIKVTGRKEGATHASVAAIVVPAVRAVLDAENHRKPHSRAEADPRPAWDARVHVHPPGYEAPFGAHYFGENTVDVPRDWRR